MSMRYFGQNQPNNKKKSLITLCVIATLLIKNKQQAVIILKQVKFYFVESYNEDVVEEVRN